MKVINVLNMVIEILLHVRPINLHCTLCPRIEPVYIKATYFPLYRLITVL